MSRQARIVNATRGSVVCEHAKIADRPLSRMRGLLGRRSLPPGEGLLLTPAPAIHTAFMRFPIDALFLDGEFRVVHIVEELKPWRSAGKRHSLSVVELAAGEAARGGVEVGDRLQLEDLDAGRALSASAAGEHNGNGSRGRAAPERRDGGEQQRVASNGPAATRRSGEDSPTGMRVMVITSDRRFREVASLLLARRGCVVAVPDGPGTLAEHIERHQSDVAVIDAARSLTAAARTAAAVEAISRQVGIVVVGNEAESGLMKFPIIPKWGSFGMLFEAVEQANPRGPGAPNAILQG